MPKTTKARPTDKTTTDRTEMTVNVLYLQNQKTHYNNKYYGKRFSAAY